MVLYDVYYGIYDIYIYTICEYMYVESTEYYCNYYGDSEIGFWYGLFCLLWGLAGWNRFFDGDDVGYSDNCNQ